MTPETWDDKLFELRDKVFIKDRVLTLSYMTFNFGQVMKRLDRKVSKAEATVPDWLCLSEHKSKWNMDLYLAVDKALPGADNTTLNGKFFSIISPGKADPITGPDGNPLEGSISVIEKITLGGQDQYIIIRGADSIKPVILFLHGGPGENLIS